MSWVFCMATLLMSVLVLVLQAVDNVTWWDTLNVAVAAGFMVLFSMLALHLANNFSLKKVLPC